MEHRETEKRWILRAGIIGLWVFIIGSIIAASWQATLLRGGIESDGTNVKMTRLIVTTTGQVAGAVQIEGKLTADGGVATTSPITSTGSVASSTSLRVDTAAGDKFFVSNGGAITAAGIANTSGIAVGNATGSQFTVSTGGNVVANGTVNSQWGVRVFPVYFSDTDVAANQSSATLGLQIGANVGGADFTGVPVPWAGSLVGIAVYSNAACTSETLRVAATVNGTATLLYAGLNMTDDTQTSYTTAPTARYTFTAGQRIGVKMSTDAEWVPTTADVLAVVYVSY